MKTTLKIKGMHCASCAVSIQKDLGKVLGVKEVSVNYATQKGYVDFDENQTNNQALVASVRDTGYDAEAQDDMAMPKGMHQMLGGEMMSGMDHTEHAQTESQDDVKKRRNNFLLAVMLTVPVMILSFFADI